MPPMPANLVPMVDDTSNTKGAELQAQEAEVLRDHMESIRNRLKLEREFEGIDPFAIADDDIERAMELGVLPVPMIADYVKDMWELARLRALGHPLPLWVVRFIEAVLVLQRHWRRHKSKLFRGHKHLVDSLFNPARIKPSWDTTMTQLLENNKREALRTPSSHGRHWDGKGNRKDWEGRKQYLAKTAPKWNK